MQYRPEQRGNFGRLSNSLLTMTPHALSFFGEFSISKSFAHMQNDFMNLLFSKGGRDRIIGKGRRGDAFFKSLRHAEQGKVRPWEFF